MKIIFRTAIFIALWSVGAGSIWSQECDLQVLGFDRTSPDAQLDKGSADAIDQKTKKKISSVLDESGFRSFGRIPNGKYHVHLSAPGYKTTIQHIQLTCDAGNAPVAYRIEMWKGDSGQFVTNPKVIAPLRLIRLDRPARVVVAEPGAGRVAQPGGEENVIGFADGAGVLNNQANQLPQPAYPPAALAVNAGGSVNVRVLIDEQGIVISASAVSGHPLLRTAAEAAAKKAKFAPTRLSGQPVKISGILVYNFVP